MQKKDYMEKNTIIKKVLDIRKKITYNSICKVFLVYTCAIGLKLGMLFRSREQAMPVKRGIQMAKNLSVSVLLDFYGELLTPKQSEALDFYYNQDLSLAEIAEEMQVSRQGVRAFIKQGEGHLANYEEKLHLAGRFSEVSKIAEQMQKIVDSMEQNQKTEELSKKINGIKSRL